MARMNRGYGSTPEEVTAQIRKKAFELYERSGRKPGHDLDNWLEAERIVKRQTSTC